MTKTTTEISCPVNDPECLGADDECHDACEAGPSERPWRIWEEQPWEPKATIMRADGCSIAEISAGDPYTTPEENEANARHIVKCVNSHDSLLSAINNALDKLFNDGKREGWVEIQQSAVDALYAARDAALAE